VNKTAASATQSAFCFMLIHVYNYCNAQLPKHKQKLHIAF